MEAQLSDILPITSVFAFESSTAVEPPKEKPPPPPPLDNSDGESDTADSGVCAHSIKFECYML